MKYTLAKISFMKEQSVIFFYFLLVVSVLSCSKEDETKTDLTKVTLSLSVMEKTLTLPSAMTASLDNYARTASGFFELARNNANQYMELLSIPRGSSKSVMGITPLNGPTINSNSFMLYTGQDGSFNNIGYRVTDAGSKYVFEYLRKSPGATDWYRYLYAEEIKDQSTGSLMLYDLSPDNRGILEAWTWTHHGDDFTLTLDSHSNFNGSFKIDYTINTATHAGTVIFFQGTSKLYDMAWNSLGTGSWKVYNNGAVTASGTW
jgi:hypothetical protein